MAYELPTPENPVMSTMRQDGSRRWMYPRLAAGRFWHARRWLAYALIAIFTLVPYLRFGGKPLVLLDLPARRFTILGMTFLPTDTVLLALLLVTANLGVCLITALLGRVWCGWMCPQTVYMEFVYRPLERLFDGPPGIRHTPGKQATPLRKLLKAAVFLLVSALLAHTFLAYFVGVNTLAVWMTRSPLEHPAAFLLVAGVTALMMFDFGYFREQTCLVACPYGRFQSVMLDRDSLIVTYDPARGEPRAKGRRHDGDGLGDCVDCGMCTDACPTGIDIRDGLQMECVACTQCIDACDSMMDRLKRPRGLIRFSSQARIAGQPARLVRPRVILYPAVILVFLAALAGALAWKSTADVTLLRGLGRPFYEGAPGEILNQLRVKIQNRSAQQRSYHIDVAADSPARLSLGQNPLAVDAGQSRVEPVMISLPRSAFEEGQYELRLRVSDGHDFDRQYTYRLLGPHAR
ncbi:MAG: cytochrome c oxidase accessory protein CcoG [Thermoguttaceae bacterium]